MQKMERLKLIKLFVTKKRTSTFNSKKSILKNFNQDFNKTKFIKL